MIRDSFQQMRMERFSKEKISFEEFYSEISENDHNELTSENVFQVIMIFENICSKRDRLEKERIERTMFEKKELVKNDEEI